MAGFFGMTDQQWKDAKENSAAQGKNSQGYGGTNAMGRSRMGTSAHMQKGLQSSKPRDPMQGLLALKQARKARGNRESQKLPIFDIQGLLSSLVNQRSGG